MVQTVDYQLVMRLSLVSSILIVFCNSEEGGCYPLLMREETFFTFFVSIVSIRDTYRYSYRYVYDIDIDILWFSIDQCLYSID